MCGVYVRVCVCGVSVCAVCVCGVRVCVCSVLENYFQLIHLCNT